MFSYLSDADIPAIYRSCLTACEARCSLSCGQYTIEVPPQHYEALCHTLKTTLGFESLIDLLGVDYLDWPTDRLSDARFGVVVLLLSISRNERVAVRTYACHDDFPVLPSLSPIWPAANWYEREAFDLFGISFEGHPDLRRILTDYGFIGFPFRKDFPVSGYAEVRYDPDLKRVVYQPVTIEPREIVQRVIREPGFAAGAVEK